MKDEDKTKERLMEERDKMRQRTAELEVVEAKRKQTGARIEHLNLVLKAIRGVNQLVVRERGTRETA